MTPLFYRAGQYLPTHLDQREPRKMLLNLWPVGAFRDWSGSGVPEATEGAGPAGSIAADAPVPSQQQALCLPGDLREFLEALVYYGCRWFVRSEGFRAE